MQQYITKSKQGKRRATAAFENIIKNVPNEVQTYLSKYFSANVDLDSVHLGDVPNLYSIIPLAQNIRAPIFALKGNDRLAGAQYQQAQTYSTLIADVSNKIVANIG